MNNILGILMGLLSPGVDFGSVMNALGGAGAPGASSLDGLSRMMNTNMTNARLGIPLRQNQQTINGAIENVLDRLGINPFTGSGQGASALLGHLYHIAPDMIGTLIGVPNGASFFSQIANGASGIGSAAGYGTTDVLNPYSVMASHKRAMEMGRMIYDLGVNKNGGYNIGYSHGLNMQEMGMVSQRLLSSRIPYMETEFGRDGSMTETGRRLNLGDRKDADAFKDNLERLGGKFNEAASMLSKITGSVKDAIRLMDDISGGNFLGGTAQQASDTANRAMKMATAIRVTSAIAGTSPQETYATMMGMRGGIVTGMGASAGVAEASGYSGFMTNMAYTGTMAYAGWAAMNPNASPLERQRALFAANSRVQSYARSNSARFAAAIAANANMFSEDEINEIMEAMRQGNPNAVRDLVRERIGDRRYNAMMNDPAMAAATRAEASTRNQELMSSLDDANIQGNLPQAEAYGARRKLNLQLSDMDRRIYGRVGKGSGQLSKVRNEAEKEYLARIAKERLGYTDEAINGMSLKQLNNVVMSISGIDREEIARGKNLALIESAKRQIDDNTMTEEQENDAKKALIDWIEGSGTFENGSEGQKKAIDRVENGEADKVINDIAKGMKPKDRKDFIRRITGGRLFRSEADRQKESLDDTAKTQDDSYTTEDRLKYIENAVKRRRLESGSGIGGLIAGKDFLSKDINVAMDEFVQKAGDSMPKDTFLTGTERMLSAMFDGKFGNMEGDDLDKLKKGMAKQISEDLRRGNFKSPAEAFASYLANNLTKEQKDKIGQDNIDAWIKQAGEEGGFVSKSLSKEKFFSSAWGVVNDFREKGAADDIETFRSISSGDLKTGKKDKEGKDIYYSDKEATDKIRELSKSMGIYSGDDNEFAEKQRVALEGMLGKDLSEEERRAISTRAIEIFNGEGGGDYRAAVEKAMQESGKDATGIAKDGDFQKTMYGNLLKGINPKGIKPVSFDAMAAGGSTDQALMIMSALMFRNMGGDMNALKDLGGGWENVLSKLDDVSADASQNPFANAFKVGGPGFSKEAVKSTEERMATLKDALERNGIKNLRETVDEAFGTDQTKAEAARKRLEEASKKARRDAEKDFALLDASRETSVGGVNTLDLIMGGQKAIDAAKKKAEERKEGGASSDMLDVARGAARKESDAYKVMDELGKIVSKVLPFFSDPMAYLGGQSKSIPVHFSNPADRGQGFSLFGGS